MSIFYYFPSWKEEFTDFLLILKPLKMLIFFKDAPSFCYGTIKPVFTTALITVKKNSIAAEKNG